jgi:hypothetical protein
LELKCPFVHFVSFCAVFHPCFIRANPWLSKTVFILRLYSGNFWANPREDQNELPPP